MSFLSGWTALLIAGTFEVGFTTFLKLSQGFSKWPHVLGFALCAMVSFTALNRSLDKIELGTAYAVWTGIGAAGTVLVGVVFFGESVTVVRFALLATLVGSIIGLKFS